MNSKVQTYFSKLWDRTFTVHSEELCGLVKSLCLRLRCHLTFGPLEIEATLLAISPYFQEKRGLILGSIFQEKQLEKQTKRFFPPPPKEVPHFENEQCCQKILEIVIICMPIIYKNIFNLKHVSHSFKAILTDLLLSNIFA